MMRAEEVFVFTHISHVSIVPTTQVFSVNALETAGTFSISHLIFTAEKYDEIGSPANDFAFVSQICNVCAFLWYALLTFEQSHVSKLKY